MPQIPDFQAAGTLNPQPGPSPAGMPMGSPVASALEGLGQAVGGIADEKYHKAATLALATAKSEYLQKTETLRNDVLSDPDYTSWRQKYQAGEQKIRDSVGANIRDPDYRADFGVSAADTAARTSGAIDTAFRARHVQVQKDALGQTVDENINTALKTPDAQTGGALLQSTNELIDAGVGTGLFTGIEAKNLKRAGAEKYAKGRAELLDPQSRLDALTSGMTRDASGSATFSKTNDWRDMLRPDERMQLIGQTQTQIHTLAAAQGVEERRAAAAQAKAERDAAEASYNNFATQIIADPTQVDPKAIANDPSLKGEQKIAVFNALHTELTRAAGGDGDPKDTKTYGKGFFDVLKSIHAPDGDPNKITDPSQLWKRAGPGGDLTVAGVEKASAEIAGKRTAEGEAESAMKMQFLKNAHKELSYQDDTGFFKDPHGENNYLRFMAQAIPAYEAGRKAGKTPTQMLNPDSPDYIGKIIPTFKRSQAQEIADGVGGDGTAPAPAARATAPNINTPAGLQEAVHSGRMTRAQGEAEAIKRGYIRNPAASAQAAQPTGGITVPASIH